MNRSGFYLVARGFLDHPRFRPTGAFTAAEAMLWLIEAAAYEPYSVSIRAHSRRVLVPLERGQMCHSIRFLADTWRWSPGRVQRFLNDLRDDGTISTHTDTGQTVITLCNYDEHQTASRVADTHSDTHTDTQSDTHTDTKKNEIKEINKDIARSGKDGGSKPSRPKNRSSEPDGFADWYAIYPKKTQRIGAAKAFGQMLARGDIDIVDLMARTRAFADQWSRRSQADRQFCPYPASWLRAGGYDDEGLKPKASATPTSSQARPEEFPREKWRGLISVWREHGQWSPLFGPPPGTPGCLVPIDILSPNGGPPNGATH